MKAYQWLTLSAAIAITALQGWLFTSVSGTVSPVETRAGVVTPEAAPPEFVALERTGRDHASGFGKAP